MILSLTNFLFWQAAPERPFTYGAFGSLGVIIACLVVTMLAGGVIALFRLKFSKTERAIGVLAMFSIAFFSFLFFAYTAFHDALMEDEYNRALQRHSENSRQQQLNSNAAVNTNSR